MKRTRLITARERKHWTQEDLAGILGVSVITVSRWETGAIKELRASSIEQLCTVYGMTAIELGLEEQSEDILITTEEPGATMKDLFSSIQRDLTTLLMNTVVSWPRRNHNYHELQGQINETIDQYSRFVEEDDDYIITRRAALRSLAQLPIAFCGLGMAMSVVPVKKNIDETLTYVAGGIAACWHFRKGRELALGYDAISAYIPVLTKITSASSEQHRKAAATLLVQSYLLKASLSLHVSSNDQAVYCHKEALRFAQMAESPLLQAVAWRVLMITHSYAGRYDQALLAVEKAHAVMNESMDSIPSTVQSYVYSGLALSQARQGQSSQAMTSLKQAHKTFDHNAPPPIWVLYSLPILADCDGLTQYYLGRYEAATDSLAQIHKLPDVSAVGRIEVLFDQAEVEVSRDDKPRDQERVIELWTQGMQGTRELKSEQRYNEARKVLQLMFVAWPGEPRVKELRDLAGHW